MATKQDQLDSCMEFDETNSSLCSEPSPAEMEKIINFDCKCQRKQKENSERQPGSCSQKLDPDVIWETRRDMAALSRDHRDLVLLGIIKTCMNDSDMTRSTKKVNTKRQISRSTYMVNAVVVCRPTFCFVYG